MKNEQIIRDAISRSISHTEIVHVEVDESDTSEIHSLVMATQHAGWDCSDENRDEEGREVIDVYSLTESADQWRIKVTFAGSESIQINDRVEGGQRGTEDHDTGRVVAIEAGQVTVAWDSLVETTQHVSLVSLLEAAK